MKPRPRKRGLALRAGETSVRPETVLRVERALLGVVTLAFGGLYLLGERTIGSGPVFAEDSLRIPVSNGTTATASIIGLVLLNGLFVAAATAVDLL